MTGTCKTCRWCETRRDGRTICLYYPKDTVFAPGLGTLRQYVPIELSDPACPFHTPTDQGERG